MSHYFEHLRDPQDEKKGYLIGNDYALPYQSSWSGDYHEYKDVLRHMNCSYFSTHGQPPTLLALKQHAQSLARLISLLEPTLFPMDRTLYMMGGAGIGDAERRARHNDSFDWLNDLKTPYWNDDPNHHQPLNALINKVKKAHDVLGVTYHCPLEEAPEPRKPGQLAKPYASHHQLLMHANECLERLDHEFSSTGGLLSILPQDEDGQSTKEVEDAKNSLVGQWLLHTGHLVGRQHELEIAYGNCLDALSEEAVVPAQHLSSLGPDARASGREIAYPQDRWLLVNAGDDVFSHLHDLFDRNEALLAEKEDVWRAQGVMGERAFADAPLSDDEQGDHAARGIVAIDLTARYYRLRGQGRSTIFVVPAWEHHPGVQHTREIEKRPTVVSVVTPKFPVRASALEERYNTRIERARQMEIQYTKLVEAKMRQDGDLAVMRDELDKERVTNNALQAAVGREVVEIAAELEAEKEEKEDLSKRLEERIRKNREQEAKINEEQLSKAEAIIEKRKLVEQLTSLGCKILDDGKILLPRQMSGEMEV